jgi:hypothetical protein
MALIGYGEGNPRGEKELFFFISLKIFHSKIINVVDQLFLKTGFYRLKIKLLPAEILQEFIFIFCYILGGTLLKIKCEKTSKFCEAWTY